MNSISFFKSKDGSGDYDVVMNGERIGYLCKRHNSGSGRALAGYVGATPPYDYWRWLPASKGNPKNFDKFLEAKRHIVNLFVQ